MTARPEPLRFGTPRSRRDAALRADAAASRRPLRFDAALRAEQRRMAVLALVSCGWLLGAALIGTPEALAYLAPPLALIALLALGRYPGADVLERHLAARRRPAPRRATLRSHHRPVPKLLPRGGTLLAAGLASRAPPVVG